MIHKLTAGLIYISALCFSVCHGTYRYYQTYLTFGSGDTMIQNYHAHGGSTAPHRKWNLECLDGEAMVGIMDLNNDFIRFENVWCKFMFPYKPPTNGLYPYYPSCHVRNVTDTFHCYDPTRHSLTSNTFVTAIMSQNLFFWLHRLVIDNLVPYKCCKTPLGYYIDYVSCYYMPTHDMYFEYYDSYFQFIVYCAQGYVMTGLSKKINPWTTEYRVDWIQCCRVGFGSVVNHPPPVTYMPSGVPTYRSHISSVPVSSAYQSQYRSRTDDSDEHALNGSISVHPPETLLNFFEAANRPDVVQSLLAARDIRPEPIGSLPLDRNTVQRIRRRTQNLGA